MNQIQIFKELEKIEKLPVSHIRKVCKMWYETYFDERNATEWFNKHIKDFNYFFQIESNLCCISINYVMWGQADLIECTGRTTQEACKKAITKFYKSYKK